MCIKNIGLFISLYLFCNATTAAMYEIVGRDSETINQKFSGKLSEYPRLSVASKFFGRKAESHSHKFITNSGISSTPDNLDSIRVLERIEISLDSTYKWNIDGGCSDNGWGSSCGSTYEGTNYFSAGIKSKGATEYYQLKTSKQKLSANSGKGFFGSKKDIKRNYTEKLQFNDELSVNNFSSMIDESNLFNAIVNSQKHNSGITLEIVKNSFFRLVSCGSGDYCHGDLNHGSWDGSFKAVYHYVDISQAPVPIPPAFGLFGAALIGLVGLNKKYI